MAKDVKINLFHDVGQSSDFDWGETTVKNKLLLHCSNVRTTSFPVLDVDGLKNH